MGHLERCGDLGGDPRRPLGIQGTVAMNEIAELGALHPPGDDVDASVLLACGIQRYDVGVVQSGHCSGLAAQALPHHGVSRYLWRDHLERDRPVEPQLASAVEGPDPADADEALDLEPSQGGARRQHPV